MPNINIDTVQECNLLCKCIIDYVENKSVNYKKDEQKLDFTNSKGNYINYSDTNYEVQEVKFNGPSDFTIDGEKFDMEVVIKHTNPSHIHYFLEDVNSDKQNKYFHYHKGEIIHKVSEQSSNKIHYSNVYLHILYNIGEHKNTRINNFFSQFIHRSGEIDKLKNWSLDQLIPKTRSFFMYEEGNNVRIIFDSIETIDKGIYDLLSPESISISPDPTNGLILYKKNIEVITDEKYKSDIRQQIKELVGMRVALTQQSKPGLAQDYMKKAGEILYEAKYGGDFDSYQDNQSTAIKLANAWKDYGRGEFKKKDISEIDTIVDFDPSEYIIDTEGSNKNKIMSIMDAKFEYKLNTDLGPGYDFNLIKKQFIKYGRVFHNPRLFKYVEGSDVTQDDDGVIDSDGGKMYDPDSGSSFDLNNKYIYNDKEDGKLDVDSALKDIYPLYKDYESQNYIGIFVSEDQKFNIRFFNELDIRANIDAEGTITLDTTKSGEGNVFIEIKSTSSNMAVSNDGFKYPTVSSYCVVYKIFSGNKKFIYTDKISTDNIYDIYPLFTSLFGNEPYMKENNLLEPSNYYINAKNIYISNADEEGNTIWHGTQNTDITLRMVNANMEKEDLSSIINERFDLVDPETIRKKDIMITKGFGKLSGGYGDAAPDDYTDGTFIGVNLFLEPNLISARGALIRYLKDNDNGKSDDNLNNYIKILARGEEMYRTRGGYECQNWHSNEVHYEGIWNIFKAPILFPKGGKIWPEMSMDDRRLIQDGLLVAKKSIDENQEFTKGSGDNSETMENIKDDDKLMDNVEMNNKERRRAEQEDLDKEQMEEINEMNKKSKVKWFSHNKCRNPGNKKAAPWCYTKNPKKRWDYCTEPDYSGKIARVVLMIVFLFCILLAFLMVKVLFRHEYFTAFIARLTGAQVGSEIGGSGAK